VGDLDERLRRMSADQKMDAAIKVLLRIERHLAAIAGGGGIERAGSPSPAVASDAELDSAAGDEEVKKDPKRWKGEPVAPCKMSEAPPDWLDELAGWAEWAADASTAKAKAAEAKGDPIAAQKERGSVRYRLATARRARGWAARKRKPAPPPAPPLEEKW
jgi:hypothetical protein